jgi:hypothetical protein
MKHTTKNQVNSWIVFLFVVFCACHLHTSFQVYIFVAKWDIYYRCQYIGPSFLCSMLSQIFVSLFPELYLSCHLFIFLKMSGCTHGRTCGSSRLLWNYCLPILKSVYLLSILHHLFEFISQIVVLADSRNIQFLIVVSCARSLLQLAISNYI